MGEAEKGDRERGQSGKARDAASPAAQPAGWVELRCSRHTPGGRGGELAPPPAVGGGAAKGLAEMWEGWACGTCREEEEGQSIGEENIKEAPNPGQGLQAPLWRGLLKKSLPV